MAAAAISAGVTGNLGCPPGLPAPVMAQVMITSLFIGALVCGQSRPASGVCWASLRRAYTERINYRNGPRVLTLIRTLFV